MLHYELKSIKKQLENAEGMVEYHYEKFQDAQLLVNILKDKISCMEEKDVRSI